MQRCVHECTHSILEFARCGCNNTCNCVLADGSCTGVTGLGTPISPYKVNVKVDGDTVKCTAGGLVAAPKINVQDTDSVDMTISGSGTGADPFIIKSDVLIQDDGTGPLAGTPDGGVNLLKLNPGQGINGLYVSCEDIQDCVGAAIGASIAGTCLLYNDASNKINVELDADATNIIGCGTGPTGTGLYAAGITVVAGTCATVTGTGTLADPLVINAKPDPACPQIVCGPGGLCVNVQVVPQDTATVDMVVTGTGTNGDPFVVSANTICQGVGAIAQTQQPGPGCIGVTGGGCPGDPYIITLGISNDACNTLQCHGNGLFAPFDPLPSPPDASFNTAGGLTFGPFNGNVNTVVDGPHCFTWTNTDTCRSAVLDLGTQMSVDQRLTGGNMRVLLEFNLNGGGFGSSLYQFTSGPSNQGANMQANATVAVVPPGGTFSACVQVRLVTGGAVNAFISTLSYTGVLRYKLMGV